MQAKPQPLKAASSPPAEPATMYGKNRLNQWLENLAPHVFIWPAVLLVLLMAVFPLFVSLYLSFARVGLVRGGYEVTFIGFDNYAKLFFGSERRNFLGRWDRDASFFGLPGAPNTIGWILLILLAGILLYMLYSHIRRMGHTPLSLIWRVLTVCAVGIGVWLAANWAVAEGGTFSGTWLEGKYWLVTAVPALAVITLSSSLNVFSLLTRLFVVLAFMSLAWLAAITLSADGLPGIIIVTLIFVIVGVAVQYVIGLGLALLVTQNLPGKRFFRVVFMLPMLITPVGIGFLFRMITDTVKGPFAPLWAAAGLSNFSWVDTASGARAAILITDTWQWTPFMFIILLAALEGISNEPIEAALVDGANRWQMFRFIVLPEIMPVSITLVLIRMIESFKIIDLPRIMTRGGPGTATESMTLYAFNQWKASATSIGFSSAIAYMLLILVTFFALVLVNIARRRILEAFA